MNISEHQTPLFGIGFRWIQIRHLLPRVTLAAKVPGQRLPKNPSTSRGTQFGRSRHAKRDRDGMFTFTFRWNMGRVKRMKRAESKPKRYGASQNEWPEYVLETCHTSKKIIHFRGPTVKLRPTHISYMHPLLPNSGLICWCGFILSFGG